MLVSFSGFRTKVTSRQVFIFASVSVFTMAAVLFLMFLVYFPSEQKLIVEVAGEPQLIQAEAPLSVGGSLVALLRFVI